jgi:hypothetical protein
VPGGRLWITPAAPGARRAPVILVEVCAVVAAIGVRDLLLCHRGAADGHDDGDDAAGALG